jgi:opacity protein-like surface antigen
MTTYRKTLLATGSAGALLAGFALSAPANAGDWNQGAPTLKGSYAAKVKAVPAPAPIPEYEAKYYIGVHGTFTAASSGTISTPDVHIETKSISDTANFFNAGFTIGRYITPSLRAELAFDFRPLRGVTATSIHYTDFVEEAEASRAHLYNVERTEVNEYQYQTGMINLFHDFKNGSRFTPFIGAGIGAVLYTFKRQGNETSSCQQTFSRNLTDTGWVPEVNPNDGSPVCLNAPDREAQPGGETASSWGLALAGTAGVAVDITDNMKFDLAYRALYTSGTVESTQRVTGGNDITIKIEDRLDHELRLGLRWDIN